MSWWKWLKRVETRDGCSWCGINDGRLGSVSFQPEEMRGTGSSLTIMRDRTNPLRSRARSGALLWLMRSAWSGIRHERTPVGSLYGWVVEVFGLKCSCGGFGSEDATNGSGIGPPELHGSRTACRSPRCSPFTPTIIPCSL